jgi:SAM-dependent methyltransferase
MRVALFFLRPVLASDPCLFKDTDGSFLFPKMLSEFVAQGLADSVLVSVPRVVSEETLSIIKSWGFEVALSNSDVPKERLQEIIESLAFDQLLILTSYNYLPQTEAIHEASDLLANEELEIAAVTGCIDAKKLLLCNRLGAERIIQTCPAVTPPNRFADSLKNLNAEKYTEISLDSPAEKFLWELFFAGSVATIPEQVLQHFFSEIPTKNWFEANAQRSFLTKLFQIKDLRMIESALQRVGNVTNTLTIAAQFHWIEKLLPHLPKNRGKFVELGCGDFPLIATALMSYFRDGLALEPFIRHSDSVANAASFYYSILSELNQFFSSLKSEPLATLEISDKFLEDLKLKNNSVDFCFSRTVFEHILNPEEVSKELFRIMAPGGVMLHEIGLNDHTLGHGLIVYFDFLKYSKEQWAEIDKCTNLWRINDFVDCWSELGFDVDVVSRVNTNRRPAEIHPCWSNYQMEDLLCHTAVIKARKPGN